MLRVSNVGALASRISSPGNGSETTITPGSESEGCNWFAEAAQSLLGKDAGLHLHYITGFPASSCYAYVAKDPDSRRKPRMDFFRKLVHSPQGEPFFNAFMAGCTAPWWLDLQRDRHNAAELRKLDLR